MMAYFYQQTAASSFNRRWLFNLLVSMVFIISLPSLLSGFAGGAGTREEPFEIETAEQLNAIRNDLHSHYILIADIDLSHYLSPEGEGYNEGRGWQPIGRYAFFSSEHVPFTGSLDGNGYVIENLFINDDEEDYSGFFGYIGEEAEVVNVHLTAVDITGVNVGALASANAGKIINCSSEGIVRGESAGGLVYWSLTSNIDPETISILDSFSECTVLGEDYAGGLIARNESDVSYSYATGEVRAEGERAGAGGLFGTSFGEVLNCYATGSVFSSFDAGGLIGILSGGVTNSFATGDVTIIDTLLFARAGGLVGSSRGGTVNNSYAIGSVSGMGMLGGLVGNSGQLIEVRNSYAVGRVDGFGTLGGLVAYNSPVDTVENSYWDIHSTGINYSSSGRGLTVSEMTLTESFPEWNFQSVWQIQEGTSYPYLLTNIPPVMPSPVEFDYDLTVVIIDSPDIALTENSYDVTVSVVNLGAELQTDFTVRLLQNETEVWSQSYTETLSTLQHFETVANWVPTEYGIVRLRVEISAENDENPDNDLSGPYDVITYPNFVGGDGSETNPYLVSFPQQLDFVRYNLDSHFRQTADLDFSEVTLEEAFLPIGQHPISFDWFGIDSIPFTGSYDGSGYSIKYLRLRQIEHTFAELCYNALFSYLGTEGRIANLTLENIELAYTRSIDYGSTLVGFNEGTILNCSADGVSGRESLGFNQFGGLVIENRGLIEGCSVYIDPSEFEIRNANWIGGLVAINSGSITNATVNADLANSGILGGIVGFNDGGHIIDSHFSGNLLGRSQHYLLEPSVGGIVANSSGGSVISSTSSGSIGNSKYAGGLVGFVREAAIENSSSTAQIHSSDYAGGLIGLSSSDTVTQCYALGNVESSGIAGGLIGQAVNYSTIKRCFATGNVTGVTDTGGLVGRLTARIYDSYARGDVSAEEVAGGLVGSANSTQQLIHNSYSTGRVSDAALKGGLVADTRGPAVRSYWDIETSGITISAAGVGKTTAEMQQQGTFVSWDFDLFWRIDENQSYPYLYFQDSPVNIEDMPVSLPRVTQLKANYPNPFNPETTIRFYLQESSKTTLEIFNAKGQRVKTVVNQYLEEGEQQFVWNGRDEYERSQASGIYFYRLNTDNYNETRKMMLLK